MVVLDNLLFPHAHVVYRANMVDQLGFRLRVKPHLFFRGSAFVSSFGILPKARALHRHQLAVLDHPDRHRLRRLLARHPLPCARSCDVEYHAQRPRPKSTLVHVPLLQMLPRAGRDPVRLGERTRLLSRFSLL